MISLDAEGGKLTGIVMELVLVFLFVFCSSKKFLYGQWFPELKILMVYGDRALEPNVEGRSLNFDNMVQAHEFGDKSIERDLRISLPWFVVVSKKNAST